MSRWEMMFPPNPDYLSLIPINYMVEGENHVLQVIL